MAIRAAPKALASLRGHPLDPRFVRTSVFEVIPPVFAIVQDMMAKAGAPAFDTALSDQFGKGSLHLMLRDSWQRRHATWNQNECRRVEV